MFETAFGTIKPTKFTIILYLGILLLLISVGVKLPFIEAKDLFGLSIGMILSGLSVMLGHRKDKIPVPGYIISQEGSYLGWFGVVVVFVGAFIAIYFLARIFAQIL
ncbi:MAG: hypothetical protein WBB68_04120 [Candidatus Moraniibacteriota bacterium]